MATVVNNPAPTTERYERVERSDSSSGIGFVVGLILLVLLAVILFAYGLPALRNANNTGGANISVPEKMDINVNTPSGNEAN